MSEAREALLHGTITDKIIKGFYYVYNELGPGFDEKVYENALANWLRHRGFKVDQQQILVYFEGQVVGDYRADLILNDLVIVETKVLRMIAPENEAQLVNYLKATDLDVGLLLNFGPDPEFRRRVFTNEKKKHRPPF